MGMSLRVPLLLSLFTVLSAGCISPGDDTSTEEDRLSDRRPREDAYPPDEKDKDDEHKDEHKKVVLCHVPPGYPDRAHTIEVAYPAVKAHLKHGDYRGRCKEVDEHADCECHERSGPHHGACDHDGDCACKPRHHPHDDCDDPRHHHEDCACEHRHDAGDRYDDACGEHDEDKDYGHEKDKDDGHEKDKDDGHEKDKDDGHEKDKDERDGGRKYP